MKLSKTVLILIGSYLGALLLVVCVAQLAGVQSSESIPAGKDVVDAGDLPAGVTDTGSADIPTAALPDEIPDTAVNDGDDAGDALGGATEVVEKDESVYRVSAVTGEDGNVTNAIGVYDADGVLLKVLDTPAYALPASDREELAVGIVVTGEDALLSLLEDFGE